MKYINFIIIALITFVAHAQDFSTDGNGIRNTEIGKVNGKSVLYLSELDGAVSSYSVEGKKRWRVASDEPAVLFEIETVDVNKDGNDDLLGASANGHIYCWDSSGTLLWKFKPEHRVRFSEIAVVKNDVLQIFAGGNDHQLYELNAKGEQVSVTKIDGLVRSIETGNFLEKNKQSLCLITYKHDKFRWEFFGFLDPNSKEILSSLPVKKNTIKELSKMMITDVSVSDIDNNGLDDVLLFGDNSFSTQFCALNSNFELLAKFKGSKKDKQRYAHSKGVSLLPVKDQIAFQCGSFFYTLNLKGELLSKTGTKYKETVFSDVALDTDNNAFYISGALGGGNGVYQFDLKKADWFKQPKLLGRITEVQNNIETLYDQVLNYKMPAYQKPADKPWVMVADHKNLDTKLNKLTNAEIIFAYQDNETESTSRDHLVSIIGKIALKKDKRKSYSRSRADIVEMAKKNEKENRPFTIWAGHGNDPFLIQIETMEEVLKVAPNTCYGFIYAEMHNQEDPRVQHFINDYLPRLAKAIRVNNRAKLFFRYKNVFWGATSHIHPWKDIFYSGKYKDFLIPASEDTSSRTQDINLVGRVGMRSGGFINDFAMRLVDDNPTSWRPLSPGGQKTVSPYLRQGVLMAAYGARYGINFDNNFLEAPGLNVLYALMKSGVLPMVDKDAILSIGSWHLIKDIDEKLIHELDDHHNVSTYKKEDEDAVLSLAHMHWAGTSLPDYDFSNAVLGVTYRWTNYIPEMPYGMVPLGPIESEPMLTKNKVPYSVSDYKYGYLGSDKIPAKTFGTTLIETAKSGAKQLPVLVKGASWSAIKIDDNHTRVILLDPGYLDPQSREATIKFQHRKPIKATDILTGEHLKINQSSLKLTVSAGSMRFIDITY